MSLHLRQGAQRESDSKLLADHLNIHPDLRTCYMPMLCLVASGLGFWLGCIGL